jgi:hypothetical protein
MGVIAGLDIATGSGRTRAARPRKDGVMGSEYRAVSQKGFAPVAFADGNERPIGTPRRETSLAGNLQGRSGR